MVNDFKVCSSKEGVEQFLKSSIDSSRRVIEHYDFVINDISSNISDPHLEATKGPALEFLREMRKCWLNFKNELEERLTTLKKE